MSGWLLQKARLRYGSYMLPGLRLIFGGLCATLTILVVGLALAATLRAYVSPAGALPARGALIEPADHPEWKQFLVQAALRRAGELDRLNELPGRKPTIKKRGALYAKLPGAGLEAMPEDETGSVTDSPSVFIPIDIGETSSTELPVSHKESAQPPEISKPAEVPAVRKKPAPRTRPANGETQGSTPNLLDALFGSTAEK